MKLHHVSMGLLAVAALFIPAMSSAADLKPETLKAWDEYLNGAESRMKARLAGGRSFLLADDEPGKTLRLRRGEILAAPVMSRGFESVPGGLIHDWIGAVFIPNTTLRDVLEVAHDYGRYKDFYGPIVVDSKILGCSGEGQEFSMRWLHKVLFMTAALDSRYETRDVRVDDKKWYIVSTTSSVQEIENYGRPDEHRLSPGQGNGFVWRLNTIARYEERDGGVYVELEGIGLSRDIPASIRWMVNPVVSRLSRNSLLITLRQTRDAVRSAGDAPARVASCATDRTRAALAPASPSN